MSLAASLTACSGGGDEGTKTENTPGVTATEILVGTHMPLTGPAAAGYSKIAPATKAYFDYVNANGGVHGRKITYKFLDDTYNPNTTQQALERLGCTVERNVHNYGSRLSAIRRDPDTGELEGGTDPRGGGGLGVLE